MTIDNNAPDLVGMVRWMRRHFAYNCARPDYRPRFGVDLFACPVHIAPCCWDTQDIDARMNWSMQLVGEMAGFEEYAEVEESLRHRVFGYAGQDGLCWLPFPNTNDFTGILPEEKPFAFTWTTGMALAAAAERYRITGDPEMKTLALKLVRGLKNLASWQGDRAYFDGGGGWYQDGKWYGFNNPILGNSLNMPHGVTAHVAVCAEMTGDEEALDFAAALARGIVDAVHPAITNGFNADGTFTGHMHLHTHVAWGVAYAGFLAKDDRLLDFARNTYEFVRSLGSEAGWYPEAIPERRADIRPHSEVCCVADMADIATCLARSGQTAYWDHVERMLINGIRATQFFATPRFEELYRQAHSDKPEDMVDNGLNTIRLMQGGSASLSPFNDQMLETDKSWLLEDLNGPSRRGKADLTLEINAGECCPPSAVRAIHNAWRHTLTSTSEGTFVNLALAHESEEADVLPPAPFDSGLVVRVKKPGSFFLRAPSWTDRATISAARNGKRVEPQWKGDYLVFLDAGAGEELTLVYPQVKRVRNRELGDPPRMESYTIHWSGNWVEKVEPGGEHLPMYTGVIDPLPAFIPD